MRENEPTPELWNQKKIRQKKPEKKLKKTTKTTKITMIKQEKKNKKKNRQNAWRKKKLNPALNHAAIIRKQKKAVRSPPYPNNYEYPKLNDFWKFLFE